MNNDIITFEQMLMKSVETATIGGNKIMSAWRNVVSKIKNFKDDVETDKRMPLGERLAGNTHVVDLKNGVLLIEADHPGWIQYLRMYQKFILVGLQREIPEFKVRTLAFRVSGSKANLSVSYDDELKKSRQEFEKKIDKTDAELNKFYADKQSNTTVNNVQKEESKLPPDLLAKFESLKNSMLTNSEK